MFKKRALGRVDVARLVFVCGLQLAACSGKKDALAIFDVQTAPDVLAFTQYRFSVPGNAAVSADYTAETAANRSGFLFGYYLPVSGTITVLAEALTDDKCVVGQGMATASGIAPGQATLALTTLPIVALATPICPTDGGTGSGGGAGFGGGGSGGRGGMSGSGDGGSDAGTDVANTGGVGGALSGSGGSDAGADVASTGGTSGALGGSGGGTDAAAGGSGGAGGTVDNDASADSPIGCPSTCPDPVVGTGSGVCTNGTCALACAAATPTACSGSNSCVDTQSDRNNCGSCGHVCPSGLCATGRCGKLVFIAPGPYAADFAASDGGGDMVHSVADALCTGVASAVGRSGQFRSWISSSNANAPHYFAGLGLDGPWFRSDGVEVAPDRATLISSSGLLAPVLLDIAGDGVGPIRVWSGTYEDGSLIDNCQDFSSTTAYIGYCGDPTDSSYGWSGNDNRTCQVTAGLYCFEQ